MAVCGLPTGNALRLAPMPAIVISRGNDGAQMSWGRRDRDYLSWATERPLTHTTIWALNRGRRSVTYLKELGEGIQYLQRDRSLHLKHSREEPFSPAGSAALRDCPRRRHFSPDVLVLGLGFDWRPRFRALRRRRCSIPVRGALHVVRLGGC